MQHGIAAAAAAAAAILGHPSVSPKRGSCCIPCACGVMSGFHIEVVLQGLVSNSGYRPLVAAAACWALL
jgi:hypothetical protein